MFNASVPVSPVISASADPNPVTVSDGESDVMDVLHSDELSGSAVDVQPQDLTTYEYMEIWCYADHIADQTFPLRDIQQSHVKEPVASMGSHRLHNRNGMITVV